MKVLIYDGLKVIEIGLPNWIDERFFANLNEVSVTVSRRCAVCEIPKRQAEEHVCEFCRAAPVVKAAPDSGCQYWGGEPAQIPKKGGSVK